MKSFCASSSARHRLQAFMRRSIGVVLSVILAVAATRGAHAAEPWADPAMEVRGDLALWLDAARQAQAWEANQRRPLENGARVDAWYDASGEARHFFQPVQD